MRPLSFSDAPLPPASTHLRIRCILSSGSRLSHQAFLVMLFLTLGTRSFACTSGSCNRCSTLVRYSGSCQSSWLRWLKTALCSSLRGFPVRAAEIFVRASLDTLCPFKLADNFARYSGSSRLKRRASVCFARRSGSCQWARIDSLLLFLGSLFIGTISLDVTNESIPQAASRRLHCLT